MANSQEKIDFDLLKTLITCKMLFLYKFNALQSIFNCNQDMFVCFLGLKNDDAAKSNSVKISDHCQFVRYGSITAQ